MLLYILATFGIVSVKGYDVLDEQYMVLYSETEELRWPDTYTVKATSYSLTSNIIEDYTAWRTNQSSRIDYNKGAVKVITNLPTGSDSHGNKFEIRPETTEEELNKIVCHAIPDHEWADLLELDQILPEYQLQNFEAVGNETIEDVETVRFEYTEKTYARNVKLTLWAFYIQGIGWFPLRYEEKKYNVVLGSLLSHDIWSFTEFTTDADNDVFDASQFNCDSAAIKHTPDSEKITKDLLFMNPDNDRHVDHVYTHFLKDYERSFAHKHEQMMRKDRLKENMRMIKSVNRRNLGYTLAINKFSDWTHEEMQRVLGTIPRPEGLTATEAFPYGESEVDDISSKLPKQYDMRLDGLISPVKSQGTCGSCWTFAAAAVVESAHARINGGRVLDLSSQAILDCAYDGLSEMGGGGCHGGFDYSAYDFIVKHGLPTEEEYGPYKNRDDYCRIYNMTETYKITGYVAVTQNSFNAMKVAVINNGPLFIGVHVSQEFFQYSSGVFYQNNKDCPPEQPNHAVTLVGYGERDGVLFWILKNSWGPGWGIDGYILVAAQDNVCGVASRASYPVF